MKHWQRSHIMQVSFAAIYIVTVRDKHNNSSRKQRIILVDLSLHMIMITGAQGKD